jgi:hypothetical protein
MWKRQEVQNLLHEKVAARRHVAKPTNGLRSPVNLTLPQRKIPADVAPGFSDRVKLNDPKQQNAWWPA